jgi:hypothetical protein
MKCCQKMKRMQQSRIGSMERKRDIARRRDDVGRRRGNIEKGKGRRRRQLG